MTINAKILSQGFLPNIQGSLYSVPSGSRAYVRYFSLYNVGNSNETILIKVSGSILSTIGRLELDVSQSALMLGHGETLTLASEDAIIGVASTTSSIEYVITGGDE